jgi:hypothetical protein
MKRIDPNHERPRKFLRTFGPILLVTGGIFFVVGIVNFFMAFGGHRPPRLFWCLFVGSFLGFIGLVMTKMGYLGKISRYVAEETAPVAADTFNYVADGTKDSVRDLAGAIGEGLATAAVGETQILCHKCNKPNDSAARFCDECGVSLAKTKPCPGCNELNDSDANYCDNCGGKLG